MRSSANKHPEVEGGAWRLISDAAFARALGPAATRRERLAMPLMEAVHKGFVKLDLSTVTL
jgi:hypothetical protein